MQGLMQGWPLTVPRILDHAARWHGEQEVVCKTTEGQTVISTYADLHTRSQLCAVALQTLGVRKGDVVATLAWNTTRHLESWYGIMGLGAVCHTLNPRLSVKDLHYISNHAKDIVLLADASFLPILEKLVPDCPLLRVVVLLTDRQHMPHTAAARLGSVPLLCYEELLDAASPQLPFQWVDVDENTACGLCYTSGTTGNPKGVLYSHRSNFLHALLVSSADAFPLGSSSVVLAIVPMFHANSWGLAFVAPMVGAKLVLPGPHLGGESVYHLMDTYRVTDSAGVPTVWLSLLDYVEQHQLHFRHLHTVAIGGAAPPRSMIHKFESMGIHVRHLWGMTETSPFGSCSGLKGSLKELELTADELLDIQCTQGRPHIFCDMRIVDDEGGVLTHDGQAVGHLQVHGPIVVGQYFNMPEPPTCTKDGWFSTGDVATIDRHGHMRITDRSKDVIKTGGEWVSSIEIENLAMGHPQVAEAAVIGVSSERWGERPLLIVTPRTAVAGAAGPELRSTLLALLAERLAKFAVPDDVVFVSEIPHNATGKVSKLVLREMFRDYKLPPRSRL